MKSLVTRWVRLVGTVMFLGWGMAGAADGKLPPAATGQVDFARDIRPILEVSCTKCHGRGKAKGGFSLETRAKALEGGDSGAAVVVGQSDESYLIELVAGVDPDNVMPQKGSRLTAEQVGLLRAWVDQGMAWDESVSFAKTPPKNLEPRRPSWPKASGGAEGMHPVDRWLAPYLAGHGLQAVDLVDDRVFMRRVYLDVTGLLPEPEEVEVFLNERAADKRLRLVDRLLADRAAYAQHWLSFWNDLLRNDYRGTGYIDGGRKQITGWLYRSLAENKPYDQMVAELISPNEESEGFIKGIVWRGVVNASQKPEMQAAQNVSQVFMGLNLKCASCHDSFINDWALADAYALASVFAEENLEMYECDKPTGKKAGVGFLYPQLGDIAEGLSKKDRQARLAEIMTLRENGRLSRTLVNRFWQRFMGRGLIEPVDDMDQVAWHQDLLDWLAEDFADHGYDLQHLIRRILTSGAYQMPAVSLPEGAETDYVFTGPGIRRLTAEQFRDALGRLTGVWFEEPAASLNFAAGEPEDTKDGLIANGARWIWTEAGSDSRAMPETVYFRKTFYLESVPELSAVAVACDNRYTLWVNGQKILSGSDYKKPDFALLDGRLREGWNVVAVEATNDRQKSDQPDDPGLNPAGLLVYLHLRRGDEVLDVAGDESWQWTREKVEGWDQVGEAKGSWASSHVLGEAGMEPWKTGEALEVALSMVRVHGQVRASLVAADPLMSALGRPPREQLLTTRPPTATTLQALEMTNGETLNRLLAAGSEHWLAGAKAVSGDALVRTVFERALSREPTAAEKNLALEMLGEPVRREGVEDLLWAVTMLPEFQLIY